MPTPERSLGSSIFAAFAPEIGESANALAERFLSALGDVVSSMHGSNGTSDLYIARELFHEQFADDVPTGEAVRMAVTQRLVTLEFLERPARAAWKHVRSWFLIVG